MDSILKSGKDKLQQLEESALEMDIKLAFKALHVMAIEYSDFASRAGTFLSWLHNAVTVTFCVTKGDCYSIM
jgi:hypothetical protein